MATVTELVQSEALHPLDRAHAVAPLIAASADAIEAACELPAALLDALHGAAMFRMLLPRSLGGDELAPAEYVQVMEVIAAADASTAWCIGQTSGCSMASAYLRPDIAAEIWGDDPRAALAWGAGAQGVAKVADGGYVVTGTWSFASGGRHATWLGGHSRVEERDGTLRRDADGELLERTMLFPKHRAVMTENWNVIGLRGTGSDTYSVGDLFVPEEYSVNRDIPADRREPGTLYKFSTTHLYASGFGAVALGIARATLDAFKALAQDKTPWLAARMLRDNAVVQTQVGLAEARLGAARAFLIGTLSEIFADLRNAGEITLDQRMRIRMASTFATHQAKAVVDMAYHEAGATAIFNANPFERRFRDVNTVTQQAQARVAHFETVGAHMLGLKTPLRFI